MADFKPVMPTSVGSFPRPGWLARRAAIGSRVGLEFAIAPEFLHEAQDDATIVAIRDQEKAGLELVSDGEQRRTNFINHILSGWDGIDLAKLSEKPTRRRNTLRQVPTVVGQVKRREQAAVEDTRFAKSHTSRPLKMTVPGPMTVVDTTYDAHYHDEPALAMDIAAALNAELREMQAAGADVLQIDEPAMTRWHEKVADYGAKALDRAIDGITVPTIVHLCYGYPGAGAEERQHHYTYPELLDMLMETKIGGFSVEFARSSYPLEDLRHCEGRIVMFGCVDPGDSPIAPVAEVAERAKGALEYVAPENLWLAPDCGLMTLTRDLARDKARLLAETAAAVRASL